MLPRNYVLANPANITPEIEPMLVAQIPLPNGKSLLKVKRALVTYADVVVGSSTITKRTLADVVVGSSTITKRTLPPEIQAIAIGKAMPSERAAIKIEAEKLADMTVGELAQIVTDESIDTTGLVDKRDVVVAILQSRYGSGHGGITKETYDELVARVQAASLTQIKTWAAARSIDVTDCTTQLQAATIIARELGYIQ